MIPERPSLAYQADVPEAWHESYQQAVAGNGLVLVVGGWGDTAGDRGVVLVALDSMSGAERFRVQVPVERPGATACQVGIPALLPDGHILLPVYQWDTSLVIYVLDPQGSVVRVDDLAAGREAELDVFSGDLYIKLWLEPLLVDADSYLVSWAYRSRRCHVQCRDVGRGTVRWEAAERVLAVADGITVSETDALRAGAKRMHGSELVGRRTGDGATRWRLPRQPELPMRMRSVAGRLGGSVLFVDRRRRAHSLANEVAGLVAETGVLPHRIDLSQLERGRDSRQPPLPPEELVSYDPTNGHERWRRTLGGEVTSVACGPQLACAVTTREDRALLERVTDDGDRLDAVPVPVGDQQPPDHVPVVAAVGHDRLLLATARELVCVSLTDPGDVLWRLALPAAPRASRPHPPDRRISMTSISLADNHIYLRVGNKLWAFA